MATTTKKTKGELDTQDRKHLPSTTYAFPKQRKEPLNDASHVRNAIARFDQTKGVTDQEKEEAFHHIKFAAKKFGVDMTETTWQDLGKKPHTENPTSK